ncbi:MAG: hypothetical protein ACK4M4_03215 [Flavobacterium sp.]
MKEIETKVSAAIEKLNTMNTQGEVRVQYKIFAVLFTVFAIYQLGKCFGEFVFYISN